MMPIGLLLLHFPLATYVVMLSQCNIKTTRPSNKFDYHKLGSFKVDKPIRPNAYQLLLPPSLSQLHPVFNVNLLEPYVLSDLPDCVQPSLSVPNVILEGENSLNIKGILDIHKTG